jgi:hypothetical protein
LHIVHGQQVSPLFCRKSIKYAPVGAGVS